jgi:quercetin dioxygenase-like cupin family protein
MRIGWLSSRNLRSLLAVLIWPASVVALAAAAAAQVCKPVSQRTAEVGCWIMANQGIGELPQGPIFWHLYTYPTRAAAEAAKGPRGTVVESLGKIWLFTIDLEAWRANGGERVAAIGPLPVDAQAKYSVQYMEAIFNPGMTAPSHRHPGPEAWHTLAGETCLETPAGKFIGRAGGPPVIIPAGPPMHLTATGTQQRRALVLILHDSTKPPTAPAPDWTPKGLCKENKPS